MRRRTVSSLVRIESRSRMRGPRRASSHIPDKPDDFAGSLCFTGIHNVGQTFAKDLAWARRDAAMKATNGRPQLDRNTLWEGLQATDVTAMARSRALAANGTNRRPDGETFSRFVRYPQRIIRYSADTELVQRGSFPPPPNKESLAKAEEVELFCALCRRVGKSA